MNSRIRAKLLPLAIGALLATTSVMAQETSSTMSGRIVDASGNPVAGATVQIVHEPSGTTKVTTTDAAGRYSVQGMRVGGPYDVTATKEGGSAQSRQDNVFLGLGTDTPVNLTLGAAAQQEATQLAAVSVSAVGGTFSSDNTGLGTNVGARALKMQPAPSRNIADIARLDPRVNVDHGTGAISANGQNARLNSLKVDGIGVGDPFGLNGSGLPTVGSPVSVDTIEGYNISTANYDVISDSVGAEVNAVTKSGTNDFHGSVYYAFKSADKMVGEAGWLKQNRDYTEFDKNWTAGATFGGPIIKDKLFFFAMYEARGYTPQNTNDRGTLLTTNDTDSGFWGTKIDWHINDKNLLEFMAFSDKDKNVGSVYNYDFDTDTTSPKNDEVYSDTGGRNWALTYTSYLLNNLSMKLMYGKNEREAFTRAQSDFDCNPVRAVSGIADPGVPLGCSPSTAVQKRNDERKQSRADFEWTLGDHLVRFGYDHEVDTSDFLQHYPGPGQLYYNIYTTTPGSTIENDGVVPPGYFAYVRARRNELSGNFETTNSAYYVEDNWSITPNFLLNVGLRRDAFDNKDAAGRSYIKMDNMVAPRLGFSWDLKGDGTTKVFGNLGRYYLPVANVINIKQAGGLLDERTYYGFDGYQILERNGSPYAVPILGPQIGPVDDSQGDGTVGDLRSEVDKNMDSVYQDEAILGFQQAINDKWSWGVSGTYRKLHNAIDDMEISATRQCGGDGYVGWVMANPGSKVAVYGDTNCDGVPDGYLTVDTSKEGWAMYDAEGNYLGQRGWKKPKRTFGSLEFQLDRAWDDKWAFNASYVLSWSRGNAEGPVNSDTNFDDTGRTENFDDPYVNLNSGYLPNDHRHQFKFRGTYAISPSWQVGADLVVLSGSPITGYGVGNPYDAQVYHSYFICVSNCDDPHSENRVYQLSPRGKDRTPWTYNLGASLTYILPVSDKTNLRVKFAVYNLFNQQRTLGVDQDLQTSVGGLNSTFLQPQRFQSPRFGQLTVSLDF